MAMAFFQKYRYP